MTLRELLNQVRDELPGCELTSIVSFESGLSIAASTSASSDARAAVDAYDGEVHRLLSRVLVDSGLDNDIDDIVIKGSTRTLVSTPLGDTGYFWHLSTSAETTLGFTQAVMRKYHADVMHGVADLVL